MQKSSILTKAGNDVIKSNVSLQLQELNEQKSIESIINIKSQRSTNRLQETNDSYEQRNVIQTKYIDENGRYVESQNGKVMMEESKSPMVKKDKSVNNRFIQQPIIEQPNNKEDEPPITQFSPRLSQTLSKYHQPIKSVTNNKKPTNSTLLKNYMKSINNYSTQLQQLSKMKQSHRKNLQQSKQSYLTNSSGLNEQDFYRVDYNNSGMYSKRSWGLMNSRLTKQTASFFNQQSRREFDQIEDILSDINSLSEKQGKAQYSSARLFSKGSLNILTSPSSKKYNKGGKIQSSFSSRKFSQTKNISKPSKLDQLLQQYQFAGIMSNSFDQKLLYPIVNINVENNSKELDMKSSQIQAQVLRKIQKRKMQRLQRRKGDRFYQQVKNQIKYGVAFGEKQQSQLLKKEQIDQQQITKIKDRPREMTMIRQAEQQSQLQQKSMAQQNQPKQQENNNQQ